MRQAMICWFGTRNGKEFTGCLCASESKKKKKIVGLLKDNFVRQKVCDNIVIISVYLWTATRRELIKKNTHKKKSPINLVSTVIPCNRHTVKIFTHHFCKKGPTRCNLQGAGAMGLRCQAKGLSDFNMQGSVSWKPLPFMCSEWPSML